MSELYATDSEEYLLGCALTNPQAMRAISDMEPDAFSDLNRFVLSAVIQSGEGGALAVVKNLDRAGKLEALGGPAGVIECLDKGMDGDHWDWHRDEINAARTRRESVRAAKRIIEAAEFGSDDLEDIASRALHTIANNGSSSPVKTAREMALDATERLHMRTQKSAASAPTGFPKMDYLIGGLVNGLWVISGASGSGKSTLSFDMMRPLLNAGKRVVCFSYEMEDWEIWDRWLCAEAGITSDKIFDPLRHPMNEFELNKMMAAQQRMAVWDVIIKSVPDMSIGKLRREVRALDAEKKIDAVVVDYLQLVRPDNSKEEGEARLASIAMDLKSMSMEIGCPVISPSQLNRQGQTRGSDAIHFTSNIHLQILTDPDDETFEGVLLKKNRHRAKGMTLDLAAEMAKFRFRED